MNAPATKIISALGGTAAVARMFGLTMPSVSDWKRDGIPKTRMMYLQAAHADKLQDIDVEAATSKPASRALQGVAHA